MNIGELIVTLGVNSHQFDSKIKSATKQLFSLKNIIITVAGGYGLKKLSWAFLDAARVSENYRLRLNALLGSAKEGNRLFDAMSKYAAKVPFKYREIMSAATQLAGVMKGGVDEVKSWMPLIGDLAAASGLVIQKTTEQIIRMYAAGAAAADLFRERGILAMLGFTAGVKYSAAETRKMLIEAWLDPQSKFRGLTEEMANTWDGLVSMMSDKWFMFRNDLMEAGTFDFLKAGLKMVNDELNRLKEIGKFDAFAKDMGETITKGFEKIIKGAALISDAFRGWELIWDGLKMSFAVFSILVAKRLDKLIWKVKKFYELEFKLLELTNKLPWIEMDTSGVREILNMLESAEQNIEMMEKYWAGVLEKTDEHLEDITSVVSNYKKASKLIEEIRNEIQAMRIRKPGDMVGGISDDINKYTTEAADNAKKTLKNIEKEADKTFTENMVESVNQWSGTFSGMLNEMAWGADVTFKDIAKSFGMMVTEITIRKQLVEPWLGSTSGLIGNLFTKLLGPSGPGVATIGGETFGYMPGYAYAKGAAFSSGRLLAFDRGGVVNHPAIFPMQGGAGLMGEAGPEGVLPLKRMPGGDLGVRAQGMEGGNVTYNININAVDAASVVELMRRTPEAILGPLMEARQMGAKI